MSRIGSAFKALFRQIIKGLRRHKRTYGVIAAILGASVAILLALGISTGPVVVPLTALAATLALLLALVEHFDQQVGHKWLWILGFVAILIVPVILGIAFRADEPTPNQSASITDQDLVTQAIMCEARDDCRLERRMDITDGKSSYTVGVVGKYASSEEGDPKYNSGNAVIVLSDHHNLTWRSQFLPGYGFIELTTDNTGNAFMSFAVTNHSSISWVIGVKNGQVLDYGTTTSKLQIDAFTDAGLEGIRQLYTHRRGWPANVDGDDIVDVWSWNTSTSQYEYSGCGTSSDWGSHVYVTVISGKCERPVGKHSVDLP